MEVRLEMSVYRYIQSDFYRIYGKCNFSTILKGFILNDTLRFQCFFRLSKSSVWGRIGRILMKIDGTRQRIQISPYMSVGYGLYIGHGGPIVCNSTTILGNNVNLSQFVTIGANEGAVAHIGDNVYIGPNVCIVENISIGNNVTIGAGSVVVKSIPNDATVAGNYAKILNFNNPGRFINRRWDIKRI